ncbi:MAG: hypothetical protein ACRC45_04805 [Cetobacterium sp.]
MASQKLHKITKIVKESLKVESGQYNIDGVNTTLAKFLWRGNQEQFKDLATGDYRIVETGGSKYLYLTSSEIQGKIEAFQVAYVLDFTASKYETAYDVDINTLKDKYNQLVDNTSELWNHLRTLGFVSDVTGFAVILPELDTDEVWVKTQDGYRGLSIGNLEENIGGLIDEFKKQAAEIFKELLAKKNEYIAEIQTVKDGQLNILDGWLNQNIDRVQKAGSDWNKTIKEQGEYEVARVNATGEANVTQIEHEGDFQNDRLTNTIAITNIDSKLILMNQMFDIIVGSNRYLNGNDISFRDALYLDRISDGNIVSDRNMIRHSYDGNVLSSRTVTIPPTNPTGISHPITLDLGGV